MSELSRGNDGNCLVCGAPLSRAKNHMTKNCTRQLRFCSLKCSGFYRSKEVAETMRQDALARLEERSCPEAITGCVLWLGNTDRWGYGRIWFNGQTRRAHKIAFELAHGPIPAGLFVCHRCDTPACINVEHLSLGTPADNMRDRDTRGRCALGERHGCALITAAQAAEIKRRLSCERAARIARDMGLAPHIIYNISHGKTWRHVQ